LAVALAQSLTPGLQLLSSSVDQQLFCAVQDAFREATDEKNSHRNFVRKSGDSLFPAG
jgi:hypothetical protein